MRHAAIEFAECMELFLITCASNNSTTGGVMGGGVGGRGRQEIGHIPRVRHSVSGSSSGVAAGQLIITTSFIEHSCSDKFWETFGKKKRQELMHEYVAIVGRGWGTEGRAFPRENYNVYMLITASARIRVVAQGLRLEYL